MKEELITFKAEKENTLFLGGYKRVENTKQSENLEFDKTISSSISCGATDKAPKHCEGNSFCNLFKRTTNDKRMPIKVMIIGVRNYLNEKENELSNQLEKVLKSSVKTVDEISKSLYILLKESFKDQRIHNIPNKIRPQLVEFIKKNKGSDKINFELGTLLLNHRIIEASDLPAICPLKSK